MITTGIRKKWIAQTTINIAGKDGLLALGSKASDGGVSIGFESPMAKGLVGACREFNLSAKREEI